MSKFDVRVPLRLSSAGDETDDLLIDDISVDEDDDEDDDHITDVQNKYDDDADSRQGLLSALRTGRNGKPATLSSSSSSSLAWNSHGRNGDAHRTTAGHGRPNTVHLYPSVAAAGSTPTMSGARQFGHRRRNTRHSKLYSPLAVLALTLLFLVLLYIPLFVTFRDSAGMCKYLL